MNRIAFIALPLFAAMTTALHAQDRLFQPEDRAPRLAAAKELKDVIQKRADLNTTVALAAMAGSELPAGSTAAASLEQSLQRANAASEPEQAGRQLRTDLAALVRTLEFVPRIGAEQPAGFPSIGIVGELELRDYPAYRMARTDMQGRNGGFWTLFNHIKQNEIAMTSPVQMDWAQDSASPRPVRMAFLYGDPELQPEHKAEAVDIVEVAPQTVLSLGANGSDRGPQTAAMKRRLETWLARADCPVVATGPARLMVYNDPMTPQSRRYFEVQIPVEPRQDTTADAR